MGFQIAVNLLAYHKRLLQRMSRVRLNAASGNITADHKTVRYLLNHYTIYSLN